MLTQKDWTKKKWIFTNGIKINHTFKLGAKDMIHFKKN